MDVHPPLAKLLITLAGWLAGFNGNFDFKEIGKDYLEPGVPYVAMRLLPAICGILLVPTAFLTLKAIGCKSATAALGAALIIFENGLLTQARLILLDSPLVVFTAMTALAWTNFMNQHEQGPSKAFQPAWWFWLAATGLCLGATVSVKWVGLFTIAWVGALTVLQLWVLLGDAKTVTPRLWFKHFFARLFCLIVIPLTFYMAMFAIHFVCLVNPGEGDGFMSSEFQATLNSKGMQDVPADVAFGSRVSLRHHNTQGGYLHSHPHMYPGGSKQQQITLYPHKDDNNVWLLENQTQPELPDGSKIEGPKAWDELDPTMIEDGAIIRLYHATTHRRLHSHDVRPPITEADWQNEVSAYGYEGFEGDANDLFRVEIVKHLSDGDEAKKRVRTIQTKFRLVHLMTGCALFSHKVKLPDWGYEQQEVTCARGGTLPNSVWFIETNAHPHLPDTAEKVNYRRPGFLAKFWELQKVMWRTNAGLVESHAWDSRPPSWPVLKRGINFWGKDHRQIYLIGNPVVWWASTAAVVLYALFKAVAVLRWQRGYADYERSVVFKRFDYDVGALALGWALHYFPFFLMQRQLFLHHYFPALYFAVLGLCVTLDYATARIAALGLRSRPALGWAILGGFLVLSVVAFWAYAPLAYGNPWTQKECRRAKLLGKWDWDCNAFYKSYDQYSSVASPPVASATPASSPAPAVQQPAGGNRQAQQQQQQQQPLAAQQPPQQKQEEVTPQAPPEAAAASQLLSRDERVEFRDEAGNVLDEAAVAALQGKVSFRTRYETRTRLLDGEGNVVREEVREAGEAGEAGGAAQGERDGRVREGEAPPHPDVMGGEPETVGREPGGAPGEEKRTVGEAEGEKGPRPGSEGREATG
ncbi:glycosyltransferase family 39 protein [Lineolata rhizophorae]|uniref:Dolichyl-phosphate-mannose--protein mannosyltransferase n=1 Tax=Lineolata rhizophorae TaxID=578093 RepID=A0A6A6NL33_9PEZI|nr:glycosyltransferase family 39 protein [Lineolata rhizophorae]